MLYYIKVMINELFKKGYLLLDIYVLHYKLHFL